MSAGLAGVDGETFPRPCLGHQRSKERVRGGGELYRYDLWPLPDLPQPARGRVEQEVECGTCGRRLVYRVSSLTRARRGRRLKWAAALALLAALGGHVAAFVVLVRHDDAPLDSAVGAWLLAWMLVLPMGLVVIALLPWDASARLPFLGRHELRPPGAATKLIEPRHDPYVV